MFYLNRGSAPEGPYEEGRILQMIQSGELTQGGVCPVGQNQWWALHQIPAFAHALAQRAAAPAGYGPPPAPARGSGPAPGPTVPGHGPSAPSPGYGPPAQAAGAGSARRTIAGEKKGGRTLLLLGLGGVLLVFLATSALGAYLLFFSSSSAVQMSAAMPRDSELLIELPSLPKLLVDFKQVEYLDTSLRDDKKVFDSSADSLAKAFDISLDDARAFLVASRSAAVAARRLSTQPEAAFAIGFASGEPVEALLKSPRFVASGAIGQTGKRYQLTRKQLQSSVGQDVLLKSLAEAELGGGREVLAWFPDKKLLGVGTEAFVGDLAKVIETGAAAVDTNPSYQAAAKDFDANARVTAFLDPTVFSRVDDPKLKELVDSYFKPAGPLSGALTIKPAGFVTSLTGRIIGSKLPKGSSYEPPSTLELSSRLPVETLAYAAFQTQTKLTGAEVQKLLLDQVEAANPRSRRDMEQGLQQLEQVLGVSVAKLVDGLGSEAVFAVAAPLDASLDASLLAPGPQAMANFSVSWVQQLKDDTEYKRLAAQLKQKILPSVREATLVEDGPGFALKPRSAPLAVSLRVKFFDKYLFITAGGNSLCDRAEGAFSKGDRTLKDDAAHRAALGALPDKHHFRLWLDTGRLADTLFKNPLVRAKITENGLDLDKFRLTGPERVTSALSVSSKVENEVWTYNVDALNMQALAPLGLGAASLMGLSGLSGRTGLPPL